MIDTANKYRTILIIAAYSKAVIVNKINMLQFVVSMKNEDKNT